MSTMSTNLAEAQEVRWPSADEFVERPRLIAEMARSSSPAVPAHEEGTSVLTGLVEIPESRREPQTSGPWRRQANVFALPDYKSPRVPADTFTASQEWEGTVTEIGDSSFKARMIDIRRSEPEEEAEIPFEEVSQADKSLVVVGAVFRLAIGYRRRASGTQRRTANLVFRRLPKWTKCEFAEADDTARRLASAIRME